MSRFRLLLLGLLAVLAVGAVSAASASAQTCTGGSHFVFCTSPGNLPIENELVLGLGGLSVLAGTISGAAATFHCPDVHFHGELTTLGAGFGSLTFLHCVEEKPASCELEESTIVANFTSQQENATLATFTGSGTGNTFTTLKIKAKAGETCVAAGNFAVTGSQMVETPTGGEGKIEQEVQAKKAESNLKIGGNSASFSSKGEVHLGGANAGSAWLVMAGE